MSTFVLLMVLLWEVQPKLAPGLAPANLAELRCQDLDGQPVGPNAWKPHRVVVLIHLGVECPVSNFYSPQWERMAKAWAKEGVGFYGIYAEPDMTAAAAKAHAAEYQLTFPLWLDGEQKLAQAYGVQKVPEALVLTPAGKLLYRGRIDDRFSLDKGKRREEPRTQELADAVAAALAGKAPAVAEAPGYGCPLQRKVK